MLVAAEFRRCLRRASSLLMSLLTGYVLTLPAVADPLTDYECTQCHRVTPPAAAMNDWSKRTAPDLHYAGIKYRADWLKSWLSKPTRIRPAGFHPEHHTVASNEGDQVDAETLPEHPALMPDQVGPVVEALTALNWRKDRLPANVQPPSVPKMLAQLNFIKFKGCGSCHRSAPDYGGSSAPELYTAWHRLQPEFLWSYIDDPQAWSPGAPMPGYGLPAEEIDKLVAYLKLIGEAHSDEQ